MASSEEPADYAFKYLETGHIRLLKVLKTRKSLHYDLLHIPLSETPPFIAMSYTWDNQARDRNILIDNSVLKVIENVHTMLPYLIGNIEENYFWIDGICINQDDIEEKNIQVSLMADIYTRADSTLI
jgi:hypothetical protein